MTDDQFLPEQTEMLDVPVLVDDHQHPVLGQELRPGGDEVLHLRYLCMNIMTKYVLSCTDHYHYVVLSFTVSVITDIYLVSGSNEHTHIYARYHCICNHLNLYEGCSNEGMHTTVMSSPQTVFTLTMY